MDLQFCLLKVCVLPVVVLSTFFIFIPLVVLLEAPWFLSMVEPAGAGLDWANADPASPMARSEVAMILKRIISSFGALLGCTSFETAGLRHCSTPARGRVILFKSDTGTSTAGWQSRQQHEIHRKVGRLTANGVGAVN